jgi:hypothetical protein
MKWILIFAGVLCSTGAFAQTPMGPKVGSRPLVQITPKGPTGCKLVGTVKGTKLWAGDCEASELRRSVPAAETNEPPPAQITGTIPAGQK